jgi:CheY-like chemotaxis protein
LEANCKLLLRRRKKIGIGKLNVMEKIKTILLIDDDTISSFLNQQTLEEMQIADHILCMSDSREALEYLEKGNASATAGAGIAPDLILLDLNMPGLDGFQVLDQLNKMGGSRGQLVERVVILSTSLHPLDKERATQYNIFDYLVKPLTKTKIKRVIDRFLQSQQPKSKKHITEANPQKFSNRPPVERPAAESNKKKLKKEGG